MAVIVVIHDHHQPAILQEAEARRDQPFVPAAQIGHARLGQLEPGAAVVVARQDRQDLRLLRPMRVIVRVNQQQPALWQPDHVRVLGEAVRAAPDVEDSVGD
jgi:hypothetical protein